MIEPSPPVRLLRAAAPAVRARLGRLGLLHWCAALVVAGSCVAGCAGYRMGAASLYPPDVHTVYVPQFESDSFRRYLGQMLTEAVSKKITDKTPYQVVGTPNADSVLTGRITYDTKWVVVESATDEPRDSQFQLRVEVNWVDRRGDMIQYMEPIKLPDSLARIALSSDIVPEDGQSNVTAEQDVIDQVAEQIVSLMEAPW